MQMTEMHVRSVLTELIDENPLACRGILRIAELCFTTAVPTLAVTLGQRPALLMNLGFIREHCHSESHVKSVLLHEFLHVLLGHTERFSQVDDATNLALDIVINAIIHRIAGAEYSDMMSTYYRDVRGLARLLRPMSKEEREHSDWNALDRAWIAVYNGTLVADDMLELAQMLRVQTILWSLGPDRHLLGNHEAIGGYELDEESPEAREAIRETMAAACGSTIWRSAPSRGVGVRACAVLRPAHEVAMERWERTAWQALKAAILPDRRGAREYAERQVVLPVLNARDRRAFVLAYWSPLLPEVEWLLGGKRLAGRAQVYLDVSGSMSDELPLLLALLRRLRQYLRTPFWAFSDSVVPAVIERGQLKTRSSGGTSINSVLRHVAATRPGRAVIVTDGYVEDFDPVLATTIHEQGISAIVTHAGSPAAFERAGLPYVQLDRVPT